MGFNPGILVINVLIFVCCAGQVWFLRVGWVCPMLSLGFVPLGERGGISLGAGFVCPLLNTAITHGCVDHLCQDLLLTLSQHSKASSLLS